ncbi:SRPBCC family protein [Micromonospora sp. DR5-3]|uniref:SRPBCC family protein n=1 Tax=unclassified Micromonospora TaxID=2617518 RepID=UPI0011D3DCDF|nr:MULTISPECIES: SRPBCC family protein [unclassified Micromonospora]MCW3815057.1 SRPBCC family protein [Micromonospora sp. DR5-3]TYC25370.1 ATPase [Micromonospora sp. MP36]
MTSAETDPGTAVRTSVVVGASPEHAFDVFTAGLDRWWIRSHHLLPDDLKRVTVEPRAGGAIREESVTGQTCTWGRVLTWDPPGTFVFAWLIGSDWQVPDPDAAGSRVTVTFTPVADGTRVDLVHDRLDAHGAGWEKVRDGVGSDGGWPGLLREYAKTV